MVAPSPATSGLHMPFLAQRAEPGLARAQRAPPGWGEACLGPRPLGGPHTPVAGAPAAHSPCTPGGHLRKPLPTLSSAFSLVNWGREVAGGDCAGPAPCRFLLPPSLRLCARPSQGPCWTGLSPCPGVLASREILSVHFPGLFLVGLSCFRNLAGLGDSAPRTW